MNLSKYEYILFDLDGTLTDPAMGITNSIIYALEKMGLDAPPREELYKFIGPPLLDSFKKYYGMTDVESQRALALYREYFSPKGIFENEIYKGIPELLKSLCENGKKVVLATSKPELFAIRILEHFDLKKYFRFVCGSTMDEKRVHKNEIIGYIIENLHITDLSSVIMIGDRDYDIAGANAVGVDSCGVLYGYGNADEFKHATYTAETVKDLSL